MKGGPWWDQSVSLPGQRGGEVESGAGTGVGLGSQVVCLGAEAA